MPLVEVPKRVDPNSSYYSDSMKSVMTAINRYASRYPAKWRAILTDSARVGAMNNYAWAKELVQKGMSYDREIAVAHATRKLDGVFKFKFD